MSISIQAKTDYSFLFSGLSSSSSSSVSSSSFLTDYAMIKNGSYAKLMKACYSESGSSSAVKSIASSSTSKDDTKTIANVKSATDSLKESADALLAKGSKSVFADEDMEKIYSVVNNFVEDYNSVLDSMDDVNSTSILSRAKNMTQNTTVNSKLLSKVGITVNSDNSLSIDKETFLKADFSTVKSLFNGNGSYAYSVSANASMINYAAEQEADKAATYTSTGIYGSTYSSGSLFDSLL